jgi:RimJ/RimL family protein N-acetyltransferase
VRVFEIPYALDTERFALRCYEPGDGAALLAALDDGRERTERWLDWAAGCTTPQQAAAYVRRARGNFDLGKDFGFGVQDRASARLLGGVAARVMDASLGRCALEVWVRASSSRTGVAREVVTALTSVLYELAGAQRIELMLEPNNVAARALASGLGFRKEGLFRAMLRRSDRARDVVLYAMLREDWRAASGAGKSGARMREVREGREGREGRDELGKASAG